MENTADNGEFKDLLSAALSESGLSDDFFDLGGGGQTETASNGVTGAGQPVSVLQTQTHSNGQVVRVVSQGQRAATGQVRTITGSPLTIQQNGLPSNSMVLSAGTQAGNVTRVISAQRPGVASPVTVVRGKVAGTPVAGQRVVHIQGASGAKTPVSIRTVVGQAGSTVVTGAGTPNTTGKKVIRRVVLNQASAQRLAQMSGTQAGSTLTQTTQAMVMTRTPQGTLVARTPQGNVLPQGTVLTRTPEGDLIARTPDGKVIRPTPVAKPSPSVVSAVSRTPVTQYVTTPSSSGQPTKTVRIVKIGASNLLNSNQTLQSASANLPLTANQASQVVTTPVRSLTSPNLLSGSHIKIQPTASGQQMVVTSSGRPVQANARSVLTNSISSPNLRTKSPSQPLISVRTGSPSQQLISVRTGSPGQQVMTVRTGSPAQQMMLNARTNTSSPSGRMFSSVATQRVGTPPLVGASANHTNGMVKTQLTDKDVSRLWANDDLKLKKLPNLPTVGLMPSPVIEGPLAGEDEDEELGHAETYAEYMPLKLRIGNKHPDPVVETSSLSSVEPQDVWYKLAIPESTIDSGSLSALQLESITYACQKHEIMLASGEKAGYLIGDGAGVGKGRTVAGVIFENYLMGRKRALWLSVSNDLRVDAERDLRDIGAGKIEVHPLNKFKYAKISSHVNGSVKKGVIFATYSSLIGESHSGGKYRTRFKQLLQWLSKEFDGVIVFDECHKAKNLCPVGSSKPTKTGKTVLELQNKLPKARIIYASATGASEPRNMAYMTRLGLWGAGTPFPEFNDFIQAIEKRGVGAMELVAMDMKLRGMYIARQLSFHGVSFKISEIAVPKDYMKIYNSAVKLWVSAREKFQAAADLMDAEHRMKKSMWGQFWSAHQRFFKYLCISAKVPHCIKLAREAVKNGKCVVIGLQSTGEARTLEAVEEMGGELNDFVSTAKGVFQTLVEKHFPAPDRKKTGFMFGLSSMFDSPVPSPKASAGSKRKRDSDGPSNAKRAKNGFSDSDNSDTDESDKDSSDSDLDLSESESDSEPDDDFNPFGDGSDSDDDPWLKKSKSAKKKPVKQKKKKEKKKKEKKSKSKKKDKKSDDEFDDIDNQFDRALAAAGMKGNNNNNSLGMRSNSVVPPEDAVEQAIRMKQELLDALELLGDKLPPNTLDELIDSLGGTDNVAEMTGRKGRVVSTDDGIQYESRSEVDAPLEILNLTEKQRFMDGEKNIAIISEAASSGISLQADRRAINQRRRVHVTLELPWSADRAIQQFGRTHRSNQVSAPEYVFLISELAGERRFASTVAKRLESLGALTHGDRRATESRDLSQFNIDNKYGRAALETVMKSILGQESSLVPFPESYSGNFQDDAKVALVGVGLFSYEERFNMYTTEKDYNNISKFLNRILGMEVELQNQLFKYFTDTLTAIILQAKRFGRWDMGILDLGSSGENVRQINCRNFVSQFSGTKVKTQLHTVSVERGMTWQAAMNMWRDNSGPEDGFYLAHQTKNDKRTAVLAVLMPGRRKEKLFNIYRPNTGLQLRAESLAEIKARYTKVFPDDAQNYWQDQYVASAEVCSHAYWRGNCKRVSAGMSCEVGRRCRTYYVLSGSVLGCWNKVEAVLASLPGGHATRMQIIRLKTSDGIRIVGTLIPEQALQALTALLSQDPSVKVGGVTGMTSNISLPNMAAASPYSYSSRSPSMSASMAPHPAFRTNNGTSPLMRASTSPSALTSLVKQRSYSPSPLTTQRSYATPPLIEIDDDDDDLNVDPDDMELPANHRPPGGIFTPLGNGPMKSSSPPEATTHAFAPVPLGAKVKRETSPPIAQTEVPSVVKSETNAAPSNTPQAMPTKAPANVPLLDMPSFDFL